jgi:hypothetical protein
MSTHGDPNPEGERLARLFDEPIMALWHGLDRGRAASDEFFEAYDHRDFDPHMSAQIIRYEAQLSLVAAAADAQGWHLASLANGGIQVVRQDWTMRVFKAIGTNPPAPGHSIARREYWRQFYMPSLFNVGSDGGNLILYWMFGRNGLLLGLCKPRGIWKYRGSPRLAWRQPITYDPLHGLRFESADEDDLAIGLRFDGTDLGTEAEER